MIHELKTGEEFEKLTKINPLVIIHFWAEWNPHDIAAKNILGELDKEFEGKIAFTSFDTDQKNIFGIL
jgi:thiol-disulfide isomerase/thioredoxin